MKYRIMKLLVSLSLGIFFLCGSVYAEAGTSAAEFLKIPVGARAAALGNAFSGLSNDSSAIFWNVSGLSSISWKEVSASYNSLYDNISLGNLSCSIPLGKKISAGIGVVYLNSGTIDKRGETKEKLGTYSVQDAAVSIGIGAGITKKLSLGGTVKFVQEKIDTESGTGFAADAAFMYLAHIMDMPVNLGVSVMNIGGTMGPGEESDMPFLIRAGASSKIFNEKIILCAAADIPKDADTTAGVGAEYYFSDIFTLRCGYRLFLEDLSGLEPVTLGFGIIYTESNDYMLDYSFAGAGDFGLVHRISIGIRM